ncbi:MAG: RsmD family RNA methyltransferase, partial [Proteobacteria bacterium]|nr:RsmD family RNA methyltransferase [Pseudomonadota bacterium]
LRANVARLGAKADIRAQSVMALGPAAAPLDLIMMDPPYGTGAGAVALDRLARLGWVGPATWISIETQRSESVEVNGFTIEAEKTYGKARVTLLRQV